MSAEQNAEDFASILENTDIEQGMGRLVTLAKDTPKIEKFDIEKHRKYVESACCMGVVTLRYSNQIDVEVRSEVATEDEDMIMLQMLEFGQQGATIYIPNIIAEHIGMYSTGNIKSEYRKQVAEWIVKYTDKGAMIDLENAKDESLDIEHLNDMFKLTFSEIASLVRAIPHAYFKD